MMIRMLKIEHFRGIESTKWLMNQRLIGLVGAGDSTKTTLLDAIGLVLSPNHSPQFSDADFYGMDTSRSIIIEAAVTELPDNLIRESQLGKDRSGIRLDGTLLHDPVDDAEECLVIRLTVTPELDATWEVVRPGSEDARPISASQRRQLGFFRLGERPDYHLRWARGSALSGLTDGSDGASTTALDAHREARAAVFDSKPNALHDAATKVQASAGRFGAAEFGRLRPGIEPGSASSSYSLMLHEGEVPLSSLGLGTRRLTSLSIQDQAMVDGSIIAIDEVEHGLEPHRLAHALHQLKARAEAGGLQVIMTTHSPVAVKTLRAVDLVVVRADGEGTTTCRDVPEDLSNLDSVQGAFRGAPEALLGRRVIVGEGATEVGFLRGVIRQWDSEESQANRATVAAMGTVLVNGGGGAQSARRARIFRELGYPTCLLVDNDDTSVDRAVSEAIHAGVEVYRWALGNDLEHELVKTLGFNGLQAVIGLAVEIRGEESVRSAVGTTLRGKSLEGFDLARWQEQAGIDESELRNAIADAAVLERKEWFKREDRGDELAGVFTAHWEGLDSTHMMKVIGQLREFAYPSVSEPLEADVAERSANG